MTGVFLTAAAAGWLVLALQMRGMDDGAWTTLGAPAWFTGIWLAMVAAMMLPSVWPTVALYSRMSEARSAVRPLLFTAGYLAPWIAFGALSFAIATLLEHRAADVLAWNGAGRWAAAAALLVAAAYELTPLKAACLGNCRSPFELLLHPWRTGSLGALGLGARHGAWCVGCCWALMLSLFALGVMSLVWMAVIAGLIAFEKTMPWRRPATYVTAGVLVVAAVLILAVPDAIPGLTIPGSGPMSPAMPMEGMSP